MKKIAIAGALLALTGCVQVDNYKEVIKHPVPAHLAGYWQSKGPQSKMVSPEAIATLVVTEEGDTLDCRQWQRVIAVPGKIMLRSDSYYNVTRKGRIYLALLYPKNEQDDLTEEQKRVLMHLSNMLI